MEKLKLLHSKSEKGFTLIEMLIVITIMVTLTHITFVYFKEFSRVNKDRDFIETFSNDLMFAQEWALTHESNVVVTINNEKHFYTITSNYFTVIKKVPFDIAINFEIGTLKLSVTYKANGNIVEAGSFYMNTPQSKYKFVFNIGRGRFYVTKL